MPKSNQLRVRVHDGQREGLLEIASARGKGETLSDVVRLAIEKLISPTSSNQQDTRLVNITPLCEKRIEELARKLDRNPAQVVEDCVDGILDILEGKKVPLIVLELELRRKYITRKNSPAESNTEAGSRV